MRLLRSNMHRYRCSGRTARKDWESFLGTNPRPSRHGAASDCAASYHEPPPPGSPIQLEHCAKAGDRTYCGTSWLNRQSVTAVKTDTFFSPFVPDFGIPWFLSAGCDDTTRLRNPAPSTTSPAACSASFKTSRGQWPSSPSGSKWRLNEEPRKQRDGRDGWPNGCLLPVSIPKSH